VRECQLRGLTYAAPLRVRLRLVILNKDAEAGAHAIRDVRENEVYMGELPLMTETGTFVINGTERVIVSQLHRSPGVFFDHDKAKPIPRASCCSQPGLFPIAVPGWISNSTPRILLFVRIDRRRKLPATVLLRALGYDTAEILAMFFETNTFRLSETGFTLDLVPERLRGETPASTSVWVTGFWWKPGGGSPPAISGSCKRPAWKR